MSTKPRKTEWTMFLIVAVVGILVLESMAVVEGQMLPELTASKATSADTGSAQAATTPSEAHITLVGTSAEIQIAPNVTYDAWTFNGTVPGPTIWVTQGDTVDVTLVNNDSMPHSIDFHAAQVDWATDYAAVAPGGNETFSFVPLYPGVFMYHCGTPPVLEHIGNGMYGAIIVQPSTPMASAPGGEYVIIQSEFYLNSQPNSDGSYSGNYTKMLAGTPDYVVFNGKAFQYQSQPLAVMPNELVRLYLLNEGPSLWEAFHVIGGIMDTVYADGNPENVQHGLQTVSIPPSGGAIVDMYFPDAGGENPFVTHAFDDASIGAVGLFAVEGGNSTTTGGSPGASTGVAGSTPVAILAGGSQQGKSDYYSPDPISVVVGVNNTITWTNDDTMPHTVTSRTGLFDSGMIEPGSSWTYTFDTPGTYAYYCTLHPWMTGIVMVEAGP